MKKRIFCISLCIALLLCLAPASAGAAGDISSVDILISHPVHMATPEFFLQIFGEGCTLDTTVNTDGYSNGIRWKKVSTGQIMGAYDGFAGGALYELSVCLAAKSGYTFSVGNTLISVNMDIASFTVTDASNTRARASIQLEADNLYINTVNVVGLTAPAGGDSPDYTATVQDDTCFLVYSGYDTCQNGITWYDATDFRYLPIGTRFQPGHEYWAEICLKANSGYEFPYNAQGSVDGKWIEASGGGEVIVLVVQFPPCASHTHTPSKWQSTQAEHYKVCTDCGSYVVREEHRWGPRFDYKDAKGHAWICADCKAQSAIQPHTPGAEATETSPQLCLDCGYVIAQAKGHSHSVEKVTAVEPKCTAEGCKEYYVCSGCGEWFSDAGAKEPISDKESLILPAKKHSEDEWNFDEEGHWTYCSDCGVMIEELSGSHTDGDWDRVCDVCSYSPDIESESEPAEEQTEEGKSAGLLAAVAAGLVCFGAALCVTVIVIKKKREVK